MVGARTRADWWHWGVSYCCSSATDDAVLAHVPSRSFGSSTGIAAAASAALSAWPEWFVGAAEGW